MALQPFVDQDVPGPKRDYVGYGRHIPKVRWPDDARVAVNIVLNYEEGSEYTHPAGDGQNDGLTEIPWESTPPFATSPPNRSTSTARGRACGGSSGWWTVSACR